MRDEGEDRAGEFGRRAGGDDDAVAGLAMRAQHVERDRQQALLDGGDDRGGFPSYGKTRWEVGALNMREADWEAHRAVLRAHHTFHDLELQEVDAQGETFWVTLSGEPMFDAQGAFKGYRGIGRNITSRKQAAAAQRDMERRLQESQRLDSLGVLAAGIAHDFNNLLTVISSYTEFVAGGLRDGDPLLADLAEVSKASLRAQALTRQLLAFSRKQMLQPRVLEFNALVGGVEKMLRRLIGEDIALVFAPGEDLGLVRVDPRDRKSVV